VAQRLSEVEMNDQVRKSRPGDEQGQGLVEFALVALFVLLTLFAIIDFARVFFGYATMANGVREGARYAVVHPNDDGGIVGAARAMMLVLGEDVDVQVSFPERDQNNVPYVDAFGNECKSEDRGSRCPVVVSASSDFSVWTPIVPSFTMAAKATMHIE
jgi:hypothetical protein